MTRNSLILTLTASLLVSAMSAQTQNQGKQDKPAGAPSVENPFQALQQFSAILNGGLGRDTNRQIYRSGKLMRFDFADHYRIADVETRSSWLVYPKRCFKVPMLDPGVFPFSREFRIESSTAGGNETVDRHPCKIEDVVLAAPGPIPMTFKMKLYRAEDLNGFPMRIDVENLTNKSQFTINYSNVSLEPPDPKLFEPPARCAESALFKTGPQKAKPKTAQPAAKAPAKPAPKPE